MSGARVTLRSIRFLFYAFLCIAALPTAAQESAPPPAHLSFVEGAATLEHDGDPQPAVVNMPVVEGDRLRTDDGRIELMFPDGSAIEIDPRSQVQILSDWRVRVLAGTIEHRPARGADPRSDAAQYLDPGLQPYASSLDQNGSWAYEAAYGNVWYPNVAADWRPYYDGYWSSIGGYGWTWIGYGSWSWPTHHYGRWGFARSRWFWIPGRTWGPAWVSWAVAPGYVSWCPLGFDSRPVFAFSGSGSRPYYQSARFDSWRGWTVVSRDRFGARGQSIRRLAIEPRRLAATTPFIVQRTGPTIAGRESQASSRAFPAPGRQFPAPGRESAVAPRAPLSAVGSPSVGAAPYLQRQAPIAAPRDARSIAAPRYTPPVASPRSGPPSAVSRQPPAVYRAPSPAVPPSVGAAPRYVPPSVVSRQPPAMYRAPRGELYAAPHAAPSAAPRATPQPAPPPHQTAGPSAHGAPPPHASNESHAATGTATRRR